MHSREEAIVPCTPAGVMRLLDEAGVELSGARAVVLGRSILVGKPMAQLLLAANATVTHCHSRTRDLAEVCRRGGRAGGGGGRPGLVTGDMVGEGAVVIDVGPTAPTTASWATWTSRRRRSARGLSPRPGRGGADDAARCCS